MRTHIALRVSRLALHALVLLPSIIHGQSLPVVDFGDDLAWWCNGLPEYRWGNPTMKIVRENIDATTSRQGHPFSLTVPLNMTTSEYNLRGQQHHLLRWHDDARLQQPHAAGRRQGGNQKLEAPLDGRRGQHGSRRFR